MSATRRSHRLAASTLAVLAHMGIAYLVFASSPPLLPRRAPRPIMVSLQALAPAAPARAPATEAKAAESAPLPAPPPAPREPESKPQPKPEPKTAVKPKPTRKPKPKVKAKPTVRPEPRTRLAEGPSKSPATVAQAASAAQAGAVAGSGRAGPGPPKSVPRGGSVGDRPARPLPSNAKPRYPPSARRLGQEGKLVVRIVVLPSGKVGAADIVRSSGSGMLDQAALKAVRRWRFSPAQRAGRPVRATLNVPITFELQDRG